MSNRIKNAITTVAGRLIFALLSGCGYFMILLRFIKDMSNGSGFLAFIFAPLIICGAALVIVKLIRQAQDAENDSAIVSLFWVHVCVFIIGLVFLAAAYM